MNISRDYGIYCDMDGVLVNFDKMLKARMPEVAGLDAYSTSEDLQNKIGKFLIEQGEEFWTEMEWMPDGKYLWYTIAPMNPKICSMPVRNEDSKTGKIEWCKKHLGSHVPVILSETKEDYAANCHILIDDRKSNIDKWIKAGGIGILHSYSLDTVEQLKKILTQH